MTADNKRTFVQFVFAYWQVIVVISGPANLVRFDTIIAYYNFRFMQRWKPCDGRGIKHLVVLHNNY